MTRWFSTTLAVALAFTGTTWAESKVPERAAALPDEVAPVPAPYAALRNLFDDLEASMRRGDGELFRANTVARAWKENLAGGSGTSMKSLCRQGAGKKFYLKPDLDRVVRVGPKTLVVRAEIFDWEKDRARQEVAVVVVEEGGRWLVLGAGKKHHQVHALAQRHAIDEPLPPPGKMPEKVPAPPARSP